MKRLLVERIIDFDTDFETIEQKVATVEVEDEDDWTLDRLVEAAYSEANMSPKPDDHRVTALGKSVEVANDGD
jgi:hypothetical protein